MIQNNWTSVFLRVSSWLHTSFDSEPLSQRHSKQDLSRSFDSKVQWKDLAMLALVSPKDVHGSEFDPGRASCTSALAFSAALRILSACASGKLCLNTLFQHWCSTNSHQMSSIPFEYTPVSSINSHQFAPSHQSNLDNYTFSQQISMASDSSDAKMPHSERHLSPSSVLQPAHGIRLLSSRRLGPPGTVSWRQLNETLITKNQMQQHNATAQAAEMDERWDFGAAWFLKLSLLSFVELEIYNRESGFGVQACFHWWLDMTQWRCEIQTNLQHGKKTCATPIKCLQVWSFMKTCGIFWTFPVARVARALNAQAAFTAENSRTSHEAVTMRSSCWHNLRVKSANIKSFRECLEYSNV